MQLEAKGSAFSAILDRLHKSHRSEVKQLRAELEAAETKHLAYTEALTAQVRGYWGEGVAGLN